MWVCNFTIAGCEAAGARHSCSCPAGVLLPRSTVSQISIDPDRSVPRPSLGRTGVVEGAKTWVLFRQVSNFFFWCRTCFCGSQHSRLQSPITLMCRRILGCQRRAAELYRLAGRPECEDKAGFSLSRLLERSQSNIKHQSAAQIEPVQVRQCSQQASVDMVQ